MKHVNGCQCKRTSLNAGGGRCLKVFCLIRWGCSQSKAHLDCISMFENSLRLDECFSGTKLLDVVLQRTKTATWLPPLKFTSRALQLCRHDLNHHAPHTRFLWCQSGSRQLHVWWHQRAFWAAVQPVGRQQLYNAIRWSLCALLIPRRGLTGEVSANSQPHILTVALFSLPCTYSPVIKDPAAVNSSPTIPHHLASPHLTHLLTLFPSALLGLGKDHALT